MYRFFVPQSIPLQRVCFMSRQTNMQRPMKLCTFCNFHHRKEPKSVIYHQIRESMSMRNELEMQSTVRKKKPKPKKYAELLEVTEETTSNKRAVIKELNARDLYMLVEEPGISLDKLQKLRDPHLKANLPSANTLPAMKKLKYFSNINEEGGHLDNTVESSMDDVNLIDKSHLLPTDIEEFEVLNEMEKNAKKKASTKARKNNSLKNSDEYIEKLLIHLNIYLECGMIDKAYKTLILYRKNGMKNSQINPHTVGLYNVLLQYYATHAQIVNMLNLYDMMKQDGVSQNPQTFAALLSAFWKVGKKKSWQGALEKIKLDMSENKISFNDVFCKSVFVKNQREILLEAVRILKPNFEPTYVEPDVKCSCKLLEKTPIINNYRSQVEGMYTKEELHDLLKLQFQNESETILAIKSIERFDEDKELILKSRKDVAKLEKEWAATASVAFDKHLSYLEKKENMSVKSKMLLHPFFKVLDKDEYINTIITEIRKIAGGGQVFSSNISFLHYITGHSIFRKYKAKVMKQSGVVDKIFDINKKYLDWYLNPENQSESRPLNARSVWQRLEYEHEKHGPTINTSCQTWPKDVCMNIGSILYKIIMNDIILKPGTCNIKQPTPAFYTVLTNAHRGTTEQVRPHSFLLKLYRDSKPETLQFEPNLVPSVCPPRPWISGNIGGYNTLKTSVIRAIKRSEVTAIQNIPANRLYPVLDSLNELGNVPWKINTFVLDIITKIFQDGGSKKFHVPESPSQLPPPPTMPPNATKEEKMKIIVETIRYKRKKNEMYGLWCEALYKLSLANHFRDRTFWLPHSIDFRGRVYPIPPHLNHLTSDLGRSILCFALGKPLGPRGLDWLKIHLINLTGFKKGRPVREYLEYANKIIDDILDSAANPLTGKMWWLKSDEPWQTLAACKEIEMALKAPNIEEYVSHFPIHQDGSCNGLQHYAALGRDEIGAKSVNLAPSDSPEDVYATVVSLIENMREADAKKNVQMAKILDGFVKRKVIKQTVMTTVYGVTQYGAKAQIMKQLKDVKDFPAASVWPATGYLTNKTFCSIRQMFQSARQIQDWLTQCARYIAGECGENVEWITPLGFLVIQPYRKENKPDALKQRNAFPPNFIHSLDSTHMMLTSLHSANAGITFVSVHDCFWTHPCTVDIMNKICREQFVALHSEPILEDLSQFLINRYVTKNGKKLCGETENKLYELFKSIPEKGKFDIKAVMNSTYFFS